MTVPERPDVPFLPAEPPHWVARTLWYVLVVLVAVVIAAVALVRIPETVSGRFLLVPERGADPVRTLRDGVVTEVHVAEGQRVVRGGSLVTIQSSAMVDRSGDLGALEARVRSDSVQLEIARGQRDLRRRADAGEARRLEGRLASLERLRVSKAGRLALARELADSAASGVRSGSVSRVEASRLELEAGALADEVETVSRDLDETRADVIRLEQEGDAAELESRQTIGRLEIALEAAHSRVGALRQDLAGASGTRYVVAAPCAGAVLRLHVNAPGAVVRESEVLSEVACDGERLQGELMLAQAGVPLIRPGQSVRLRLDAFPYQRFGVRFGTVRWLGPSGIAGDGGGAFRALFDLGDTSVTVRGEPQPLLPGMGGRADVIVGRRTLAGYVLEPLRALRGRVAKAPG